MARKTTRREFIKKTGTIGMGFWVTGCISHLPTPRRIGANEKINVAGIGVGGQGSGDIGNCAGENIVALCDVDRAHAGGTFKHFAHAAPYADYRKMLDDMHKQIDAVVVATPDHTHAPASIAAMQLGKHVYCEKPLTHTVGEARRVARLAKKYKVITQMGNQGHSNSGSRASVEIIRSGALGAIREVHCWTDRPAGWWPQAVDRPIDTPPVPETLDWDLWLGVAPERPYNPCYLPFRWRGWWDFGTGAMGDMACHVCDIAFWALDLKDPDWIESEVSGVHKETGPTWSKIIWQFPKRGRLAPVKLHWYDGGQKPDKTLAEGRDLPDNGSLFIGDNGTLFSPDPYGASYILLPEEKFKGFKPPAQTLPRLAKGRNHQTEWLESIRAGNLNKASLSHFEYAGAMTEVLLLGNLSVRTGGKRIEWDAKRLKVTNLPEAQQYVDPPYRKGWEI